MPTAANRIRQYLTRKNARSSSPTSVPYASSAGSNGNGRRAVPSSSSSPSSTAVSTTTTSPHSSPSRRGNARNNGTRPRRRLQRGWWPDAQKRAERSFKAMQDLKDETFVVTEEHFEWIFNDDDDNDEPSNSSGCRCPMEPTCHLILPTSNSLPSNSASSGTIKLDHEKGNSSSNSNYNSKSERRSTSNQCAICMTEYDIGDVIIYNSSSGGGCHHAFHQTCVLDWFSRENIQCPSCRSVFYDPDNKSLKKRKEPRQQQNDSRRTIRPAEGANDDEGENSRDDETEGRPRSDTADTEALSVIVEENSINYSGGEQQGPRLGRSFDSRGEDDGNDDGIGLLPSVVEGEAIVC